MVAAGADRLAQAHTCVGLAMLVLFLLTGQYMGRVLDVSSMPDFPRVLHRSAHLYLFFTAVANIALGLFAAPGALRGRWAAACSALLLLAPFLMAYSFFTESGVPSVNRPAVFFGAQATLFGIAGHLVRAAWQRFRRRSGEC